jgi:hypothetical protein
MRLSLNDDTAYCPRLDQTLIGPIQFGKALLIELWPHSQASQWKEIGDVALDGR